MASIYRSLQTSFKGLVYTPPEYKLVQKIRKLEKTIAALNQEIAQLKATLPKQEAKQEEDGIRIMDIVKGLITISSLSLLYLGSNRTLQIK